MKAFGQLFSIKPPLFASCFSGAANQTLWHDLGKGPDSLLKCVCACQTYGGTNKVSVKATLLQKGRCYCSTSAERLGSLIAHVPKPANCPQGTVREAYISDNDKRTKDHLCGNRQKNPRVTTLHPGGAGKYYEETQLIHRFTSTMAMSQSDVTFEGRVRFQFEGQEGQASRLVHDKAGRADYTHDVRLHTDVFPRTFRLLLNTTDKHQWQERVFVSTRSDRLAKTHTFETDKDRK